MNERSDPPSGTPRERIVLAAAKLLRRRGVTGTGIRDVVEEAQAPRGSMQHYFPGGKDQLIVEALQLTVAQVAEPLETVVGGAGVTDVLHRMIALWRRIMIGSGYTSGCPIAAVVVDTSASNDVLRAAAREAFASWERPLRAALVRSGVAQDRAGTLALTVLAAVEGAILVARAQHSTAPLDAIEIELDRLIESAAGVSRAVNLSD